MRWRDEGCGLRVLARRCRGEGSVNDLALRDIAALLGRWRGWLACAVVLGAAASIGWSFLAPGGYWRLVRVDAVIAVSLPDSLPQRALAARAEPFMERSQVVALIGSRRLAAEIVGAPWYADAMEARALDQPARLEQFLLERRSVREDRSTGLVHLHVRAPTTAAALRIARAHVEVANAHIAADSRRSKRALLASLREAQAEDRVAVEWKALTDAAVAQTTELLRWGEARPVVIALDVVPEAASSVDRLRMGALAGASGALAGLLLFLVCMAIAHAARRAA